MIALTAARSLSRIWPVLLALGVLAVLFLTLIVTGEALAATEATAAGTSLLDQITSVGGIHWIRGIIWIR